MYAPFESPAIDDRWLRIPSFPGYEINQSGQVRDHASKRIIQPINEHNVYIRLHNKSGTLKTCRIQDLRNGAFYAFDRAREWHMRNR